MIATDREKGNSEVSSKKRQQAYRGDVGLLKEKAMEDPEDRHPGTSIGAASVAASIIP